MGRLNSLLSNARGAFEEIMGIKGHTAVQRFRTAYRSSLREMVSRGLDIVDGPLNPAHYRAYKRAALKHAVGFTASGLVADWDLSGVALGALGASMTVGTAARMLTGGGGLLRDRKGRRNIAGIPFI